MSQNDWNDGFIVGVIAGLGSSGGYAGDLANYFVLIRCFDIVAFTPNLIVENISTVLDDDANSGISEILNLVNSVISVTESVSVTLR